MRCATCEKETSRGSLNGYGDCGACATAKREAKHFSKDFDLIAGDSIVIFCAGREYRGHVIAAHFWGEHDGWYVEFAKFSGDYGYWKQGCDGGSIRRLGVR